ncbi:hypothetical protein MFLAVUS_003382 [Mucor flavus]|uniref:Uncharacterized protein n=1 Tax=Mucor flavus TaxID=439312 RepID=A0ABP9YSY4_9FUNG
MSVLNVCTTEIDKELMNRRYRNSISSAPDAKMSSLYRRFYYTTSTTSDSYDNYSSYTSSSRNSSIEVLFSRLLDALIFTSAIAFTAYSYLTGTLAQPMVEAPKPNSLYRTRHSHSEGSYTRPQHDPIEDSKRRRTQEWAEQLIMPHPSQSSSHSNHNHGHHSCPTSKKRSCSTTLLLDSKKVQPLSRDNNNNNMKREKKRTLSLPVNKPVAEKEDEALLRMEEKLQSLIQQGQDALSSPVGYNDLQ